MDEQDMMMEQDDVIDRLVDIEERHNEFAMRTSMGTSFSSDLFWKWVEDHRAMLETLKLLKESINEFPLPGEDTDPSGDLFATLFGLLDHFDGLLQGQLGPIAYESDEEDQDE